MRRKYVEDPLQFDFEDMERFGERLDKMETTTTQLVREGVCDECGIYCLVYKQGKKQLCSACRRNSSPKKR
ncbi:MAG: hypothetical protein JSW08_02980 [archaeon]|nr:MAG: hypothetical protein JSW08_02980 [archaeon]